ncbi:MAG TPA: hypothetical protein VF669_22565 [Tepidisphaeraceae bacterium]
MNRRFHVSIILAMLLSTLAWGAGPVAPTTQVTPQDQIQFAQKNIQAQMKELEERMFHLAELIRASEADNSAKLLMAVSKARQSLIVEQMKDVLDFIGTKDFSKAAGEQKEVLKKLDELKKLLLATDLDLQMQLEQLKKLNEAIKKLDIAIKEQKRQQAETNNIAAAQKQNKPVEDKKFEQGKNDQNQNKKNTDNINAMMKDLGEKGQKAAQSLSNASGTMTKASGSLGSKKGGDALTQQTDAVKQLEEAKKELEAQRKKLLEEIERLVRKQIIANLTEMLDRQVAVRQATASLYPRAEAQDREALLRVKQLATAEGHIVNICEQTVELIEETQFSLALPPALQSIGRRCTVIQNDLTQGRANQNVIAAEQQVERDLKDLIETFKELAKSTAKPSQCKGCGGDKNKLLAELKVLKMLQVRVNEETKDADGRRAAAARELPKDLKEKIGTTKDMQVQVRDAMDALHHRVCPDCLDEE